MHTAAKLTARHPMSPQQILSLAHLAHQLTHTKNAHPAALAHAIERLLLLQTLQTLADPNASPAARAAAHDTFIRWRQTDLARQRLLLEQQKIHTAQSRHQPPPSPTSPAEPAADDTAAAHAILQQLDHILGLKTTTPAPASPPPDPPPTPPPP